MERVVIADASCLIVLEKIGELNLLFKTFGQVIITPQVQSEFGLTLPEWVVVEPVQNEELFFDLLQQLDPGEASAIALALESAGSLLIIDEKRGRQVAKSYGLVTVGTLGVLLEAKRMAVIPSIRPLIDNMTAANFRIAPKLLDMVLQEAGE